jgi:transcriptional regulator with XRE-family HTH domain
MAAHPLINYVKTYRKQSGLLQREVAFLLGWKCGEQFARYERRHRLPTLRVALALEEVFKVPVKELFAGVNDSVVREIRGRIGKLAANLQEKSGGKDAGLTAKKLSWLAAHHGRPVSSITGK